MSLSGKSERDLSPQKLKLFELLLNEKRNEHSRATGVIAISSERKHFPASSAQRRFWFLDQLTTARAAYTIAKVVRLEGFLQVSALKQAIAEIQRRQESLRTTFEFIDDDLLQKIHPPGEIRLPVEDLRHLDPLRQDEKVRSLAEAETGQRFDLTTGPLLRVQLLLLAEDEYVMLLAMHHIICDGWSIAIFLNELATLYEAFRFGRHSPLPELKVQYADFTLWQRDYLRGEEGIKQRSYWTHKLQGLLPFLCLPTDRPRSTTRSLRGGVESIVLPAEVREALFGLGRMHDATLFMVLLSAFNMLLFRYTNQRDFTVGSPIANRRRSETENLIGAFINTLVLRAKLEPSLHIRDLIVQVREMALEAYTNQDMPFEELVEDLNPKRTLNEQPLYQVLFALRNEPVKTMNLPDLELSFLPYTRLATPLDLSFSVHETGNELSCWMLYDADLFDDLSIQRMLKHFCNALESMIQDPGQCIGSVELLGPEERHQILTEWNRTAVCCTENCVHELFQEQAARIPNAIAVSCAGRQLTYGGLDRRSNQLAHYLRNLGVGPEVPVGICMERSLEMVIGLLGILKAGGAYVPLDPDYPIERLKFMVEDTPVKVLLAQQNLLGRLPAHQATVLCLDCECETIAEQSDLKVDVELTDKNLAYVIYTSGSTGRPKGVGVEHRSIVRLVKETNYAEMGEKDVFLQLAPVSFDAATFEIWGSLLNGCMLTVYPAGVLSLEELSRVVEKNGVTVLWLTAGLFHQMVDMDLGRLKGVRQLLAGGDVLSAVHVRKALAKLSETCLINGYGPTENTTFSCCHRMRAQDGSEIGETVPIGRPITNSQVYVLDEEMGCEPVPVGIVGELYVGGAGLARGYLNQPQLTAERFVPNPFSERGERLYRTGDRVRWRCDGTLEFLGRIDHQVKLRGYRVELGEIESTLLDHQEVKQAVVVLRPEVDGEKQLVAYFVPRNKMVNCDALRAFLQRKLPRYMVPTAYVELEQVPLTSNGKVDRRALPAPERQGRACQGHVGPQNEMEEMLCRIWEEVLGLECVGPEENFFELGGHSLLAVRVMSRVQEILNIKIELGDLFARPRLADFARGLASAANAELPPITRLERGESLRLSFAQQRLWFLAQMQGVSEAYHIPFGLRLKGKLDPEALHWALDRVVARHEALRTRFITVGGQPAQRISPVEDRGFHLVKHDLRKHCAVQEELEHLIAMEAHASFNLETGPLIRGRLIHLAEDEYALFTTMHHIVSDGWSIGVLLNEVSELYSAFVQREADPLPELRVQYVDYAAWQRQWMDGEFLRQQAEYWKTTLRGGPVLLELPGDYARPAEKDYAGAFMDLRLDATLTAGLKQLSRRHGATLYMTLLAGWAMLLGRLSGQRDVVIGTPVANRGRPEIENLIGFFVNTLVLRVDLSGRPTVGEVLDRVKGQAIGAQQHQDIPFEHVVELVRPERSLAHDPLFQVMFSWQNPGKNKLELPGLQIESLEAGSHAVAKFDLTLVLQEAGDSIVGGVEYATSLFGQSTLKRYLGYLRRLLERMAADETDLVDRLPMLSELERNQLLYEWNDTAAEHQLDKCIHELFELQTEKTPEAVALVCEASSLSYGELNRQANQLAHHLLRLGVKTETLVGICIEPCFEMIVAILAVLKAGAAYLPLDPVYPLERLHYMLEDSAPVALLTQTYLKERLGALPATLPVLDLTDRLAWSSQMQTNPDRASADLGPGQVAYVIYTSGSTGKPKGVMIEHRALCNQIRALQAQWQTCEQDRILQFGSIAFDVSVEEIFCALLSGATLVLRDHAWLTDARDFWDLIGRQGITMLDLPMRFWSQMVEDQAERIPLNVRLLVIGGEAVERKALANWFESDNHRPILWNGYGPTETTVNATLHEIASDPSSWDSIGRPIANTRVYILDGIGEPVPMGVVGELYIGGAGVARGYLNRPELTAERFVPDPYSMQAGARVYKTGDIGKWLAGGNIEFLGRNDDQVKIRGYRIELGEIEAALMEQEGIRDAVVVVREDTPGDKRLVAYYTSGEGAEKKGVRGEEIRQYLVGRLPGYMVPGTYMRVEKIPLTANGKLDRKELPAATEHGRGEGSYVGSRTQIEELLAQIWEQMLGIGRVEVGDNFFALGGHSLLATQVVARMRDVLGIDVPLRRIFEMPTIRGLGKVIEGLREGGRGERIPRLEKVGRERRLPLSYAQQRLWFIDQLEPGGWSYNVAHAVRIEGSLEGDRLKRALGEVVSRHESLRTRFISEEGKPWQEIEAEASWLELPVIEVRAGEEEVRRRAREEARQPFDLEQGRLLRVKLLRLGEQDHVLLITMHHIVSDAWSTGVLVREVTELYDAYGEERPARLPELEIQYADYSVWQRQWLQGEVLEEQLEYWRKQLKGVEVLELPMDRPRPAVMSHRGGGVGFSLGAEELAGIKEMSRKRGVTLYMSLLAAWQVLLHRYSGQQDIAVGTSIAGRRRTETEALIGCFINTLVMRTKVKDESFEELLRQVKEVTLQAFAYQDVPFEKLVEELAPERDLSRSPLFQVMFVLQNAPETQLRLGAAKLGRFDVKNETSKFDLTMMVAEGREGLEGWVGYCLELMDEATVRQMMKHYVALLRGVVKSPEQNVAMLEMLDEGEQRQLLEEWNGTRVEYGEEGVDKMFEQQVDRPLDRLAVEYAEEKSPYTRNDRRTKVLILSLEYSSGIGGGVGTHVQELSAGLALAGDFVTVLSGTVGQSKRFIEGKRSVHLVPQDQPQKPGRSMVQGILDYNHTLASYAQKTILSGEGPFDLIHCHNWITYPAAVEIAHAAGIPVISTIHYLSHPIEQWWGQIPDLEILSQEENLFRNGSTFIAVSQSIRSLMRDFYSVPERSVRVIYNAVDAELFLPSSVSPEYVDRLKSIVSPGKEKIVLFAGRFHPMKGIPALLKSAAFVLQKEPNVRYLMAGDPDSKAFALEFRELLDHHPILKQKLSVLGKISRRRVALLHSVANVALLPSVYDPCPYAAIEAMVAGIPLVASDGGGLAELVDNGVTGLTIPVRINEAGLRSVDPQELAEATLLLLRDEKLARNLGKAAQKKAAETYSPEIMVRATREAYQNTLHDARRNQF